MKRKFLSGKVRRRLVTTLFYERFDCMFGDGLEVDYIMDGVKIIGLNNMSDNALVKEYHESFIADEDVKDPFYNKLLKQKQKGKKS